MSTEGDEALVAVKSNERATEAELQALAVDIRSEIDDSTYSKLIALGRYGSSKYQLIVEPLLQYHDDPWIAKGALQVLCSFWNLREKYLKVILEYIKSLDWDVDGDCRLQAISEAGEYLRNASDSKLLAGLLQIVDNPQDDHLFRGAAYIAVARAMGLDWEDIPSNIDEVGRNINLDEEHLRQARRKLGMRS